MNDLLEHITPEQKLIILHAEMATPLAVIQGCSAVIKKHVEAEISESAELMGCINGITKSVDKIKALLDDLITS